MTRRLVRWLRIRKGLGTSVALIAIPLALVACGGSGTTSGHGPLTFAVFTPFSGPDAEFGLETMSGCVPATRLVNEAGGILGHQVHCKPTDSRGDPADAIPAVRQLLATTPTLVGMLGPTSDEGTATAPIINAAKIPFFSSSGQRSFDRTPFKYFYRLTPPDDSAGYAMALEAHQLGFTRAALVFGNDLSSQGNVPTVSAGFRKLGGVIVSNEVLTPGQASYQTEVARMLSSHPQVMFTESDPQTAGAFFTETKQLNGGRLPSIIGAPTTLIPQWFKAVSPGVGKTTLKSSFVGLQPYAPTAGPAWETFNHALLASGASVSNPSQWSSDSYAMTDYDSVIIMALAMLEAHSTNPAVYNADIPKVTAPSAGATKVHSYADGKRLLATGKRIQYVGAGGPEVFDAYHNAPGAYEAVRWLPNGQTSNILASVSAENIQHLQNGA